MFLIVQQPKVPIMHCCPSFERLEISLISPEFPPLPPGGKAEYFPDLVSRWSHNTLRHHYVQDDNLASPQSFPPN